MLQEWQKKKEDILAAPKGTQKIKKYRVGRWEGIEKLLYERFLAKRSKGQGIGMRWFKIEGKKIFLELYDQEEKENKFSAGQFQGFTER